MTTPPGGSFTSGQDAQVQAIVMNIWRDIAGLTVCPVNLLDLPALLETAYQAGLGAKYTKGDMRAAVRASLTAGVVKYARPGQSINSGDKGSTRP